MVNIPSKPGTYALLFRLLQAIETRIGRLGLFQFPPGKYLYLGSAGGAGGLRARVARHLKADKPFHWHLDWLRPHLEPLGIFYAVGNSNLECNWSAAVSAIQGTSIPAAGFGASDCQHGCGTHLYTLPEMLKVYKLRGVLQDSSSPAIVCYNSL